MFTFDIYGNLTPNVATETSIEMIDDYFVKPFAKSVTRSELFASLSDFLNEIITLFKSEITIFIDGSFVTNKFNPNDIDVVIFADYQLIELYKAQINALKLRNEYKKVDVYFEMVYPENHLFYVRYYSDFLNSSLKCNLFNWYINV
ncbi:MAG: hypothetical protein EAZ50_11430 [Runella slithyformis]|nr:MAG: hypothetical protein EAZ50_11430 [Runella slithyformis]